MWLRVGIRGGLLSLRIPQSIEKLLSTKAICGFSTMTNTFSYLFIQSVNLPDSHSVSVRQSVSQLGNILLSACFQAVVLLGFFFDLEERDDKFLRYVR